MNFFWGETAQSITSGKAKWFGGQLSEKFQMGKNKGELKISHLLVVGKGITFRVFHFFISHAYR